MIFITVGTHEQGMDRLLIEVDNLVEKNIIEKDIFAQIGYSQYKPKNFSYKELISYDEMELYINKADIIITHGGPGSIFQAIQHGKTPIVIPRNPLFNEHVDDHQILFAKRLQKKKQVLAVFDITLLKQTILDYNKMKKKQIYREEKTNNFIKKFSKLIDELC